MVKAPRKNSWHHFCDRGIYDKYPTFTNQPGTPSRGARPGTSLPSGSACLCGAGVDRTFGCGCEEGSHLMEDKGHGRSATLERPNRLDARRAHSGSAHPEHCFLFRHRGGRWYDRSTLRFSETPWERANAVHGSSALRRMGASPLQANSCGRKANSGLLGWRGIVLFRSNGAFPPPEKGR